MWSKDLGRSIDYLETRPDIDHEKLAYEGYSLGAALGSLLPGVEPRFKALVLVCGGFWLQKRLPEADQIMIPASAPAPAVAAPPGPGPPGPKGGLPPGPNGGPPGRPPNCC